MLKLLPFTLKSLQTHDFKTLWHMRAEADYG